MSEKNKNLVTLFGEILDTDWYNFSKINSREETQPLNATKKHPFSDIELGISYLDKVR